MEQRTAQMRVKKSKTGGILYSQYGSSGTIFWETPTRAKFLIDSGGFEIVNGPSLTKPVGPSETKPAGPTEKKSSSAVPDGRSIDSPSSNETGTAAPLSSLAADPASPLTNAQPLAKRGPGRPRKSG